MAALLPSLAAGEPAQQMHFERLGSDDGLSQGAVMAIAQDADGFLWLGTEDGLNRYDGAEIRHYIRDRADPSSLPNNWVSALTVDGDGRLWIGTDGGGVVLRDPGDAQFRAPAGPGGNALVDPQGRVRFLQTDTAGRVWMGTRSAGLKMIDRQRGETREYRHDPTDPASLSSDSVFALAQDASGTVWVGTLAGLDRLDPATGRVERLSARLATLAGTPASPQVSALHLDRRSTLWIGTNLGLMRLDTLSNALTLLRKRPGEESSLPDDRITTLFEDDEQRLWVGTAAGLALLDRRTDRFTVFRRDAADAASLPDNHIVALFQDRSGLLWVGTKGGGVARWNPRSWSFGHRRLTDPAANNVAAFVEDSRGTLWIGSVGGGLTAIDRQSGRVRRWARDTFGAAGLGDNNVMALAVDSRDRIWIGTMTAGVERLDPGSGRIHRFAHDRAIPGSLTSPGIMALLRDSRERIWVGTYGGGLCMIDAATDDVRCHPVRAGDAPGLSSDRATSLAEDRSGLIWVGTDGGGLNVLDPASGRIAYFQHVQDDPQSLSSNTVYAVHVDERGRVWVGTRGGGLDLVSGAPFSPQPLMFTNFSENEGLPNSTVYGIESDAAGSLWLSTNRGIARFNPESSTFQGFRRSNGLQADEFNFGAHYRSPSGEILFGGPNGYNAFYPERLRYNETPPPVVLTDFLKFNAPAITGRPAERLDRVALDYRDDVITFRFAALDFTAPGENRYLYRLDGFDQDWVDAGKSRQATYTNLDGGDYVFRVRAANSDGRWNETGIALPVNVAQPPWLRWWAYLLYVLAFLLAMYAIWAAQHRKWQREASYARRLEAEVAARTAEIEQRNEELQLANDRLREASLTDPLTGLGNRRYLREAVLELLSEAGPDPARGNAGPRRFVLMVVDLDFLKPINDRHGHDGGDRVLIQVAEILRQLCRSSDRIVRWGGDEFVVLCRDTDLDTAAVLAERIRASIAKQIFRVEEGVAARTSASIGFAPFPFVASAPDQFGWEQTLALADAALYVAKQDRNEWVGWAGTARAGTLVEQIGSIERDWPAMQAEGRLDVRRRPPASDDTVDRLRTLGGTPER